MIYEDVENMLHVTQIGKMYINTYMDDKLYTAYKCASQCVCCKCYELKLTVCECLR